MKKRHLIVIGASAGGLEALKTIVRRLPADLPASVFVVRHVAPDVKGMLPDVLNRLNGLRAKEPVDNEEFVPGIIYVAPPDRHLVLEGQRMRVTKGPRENRFRPAVDPLFRSAAYEHGRNVIGVVLSGALDDGAAGLWTIKQCGGVTIVQDPNEAEVSAMPENALKAVAADYVATCAKISSLLVELVETEIENPEKIETENKKQVETEIRLALGDNPESNEISEFGSLTPITCPDCGGVLWGIQEGGRMRFRCHTGHAFSPDTLVDSVTGAIEEKLWSAYRNIRESVFLLNHLGDHFAAVNQPKLAASYFRQSKDAQQRADLIREAIQLHEHLSGDNLAQEAEGKGFPR